MNSSQNTNRSSPAARFRPLLASAALFCAGALGYLAGIRQSEATTGAAQKTYQLNIGRLHLILTAGMLGITIIFVLAILFSISVLLTIIARKRRRRAEAASRQLAQESVGRQRAEYALAASHEHLKAVFDTALDAIITMDHEGRIVEFNPSAERIFKHRCHEVVGKFLSEVIIPPNLREQHREGLSRYLTTGRAKVFGKTMELTGLRADGSLVALEVSINRMPGSGPPMFAGFLSDITERKHAEQKLQAQLARLALLSRTTHAIGERQDLSSILQVVVRSLEEHLPIDFACIALCDSARQFLKIAQVGIKNQELALELAAGTEAQIEIDQNGLSRCVNGQLVYEPDIRCLEFPFPQQLVRHGLSSLVLAPLPVEDTIFGVLVAARGEIEAFSSGDCEFLKQLSEHVGLAAHQAQLYDELNRAYEELRQTQAAAMQQERLRALGQMASGIAHDINNALSPVPLYAQSLLAHEPNLSQRAREYLTTIGRSIDDVTATLARMREFYRQRGQQLALTTVDLNDLVNQVSLLTRARWNDIPQQHGIVIEMRTELASALPKILGVENEIRDALTNLVFNAVDAMPEGGTVTLRTCLCDANSASTTGTAPRQILLEVADTGVGMDDDTQRQCLEPFFTTKGERGTGLGLAMVYGMAKRHSAQIEIESALGKGTTVRLAFAEPVSVAAQPIQHDQSGIAPLGLRILVIDDDPVLLQALRHTIEDEGHVAVAANGGQAGIDVFESSLQSADPFALVITDLGMPHIDGRKVATRVKALSPKTPVALLTGWGQRLAAEGEVPDNVDCLLSKPLRLHDLRNTLAHLCKRGKAEPISREVKNLDA